MLKIIKWKEPGNKIAYIKWSQFSVIVIMSVNRRKCSEMLTVINFSNGIIFVIIIVHNL